LVAPEHVSLYRWMVFNLLMVGLHLFEKGTVRVVHKVEAIAPRCLVTKYFITLIVFEDKMYIDLFIPGIFSVWPNKVVSFAINGNLLLIEFSGLCCNQDLALLLLSSLCEN